MYNNTDGLGLLETDARGRLQAGQRANRLPYSSLVKRAVRQSAYTAVARLNSPGDKQMLDELDCL
jgi:hypothetical protein